MGEQLVEVLLQRLQVVCELGPDQRQDDASCQVQQPGHGSALHSFNRLGSQQSSICTYKGQLLQNANVQRYAHVLAAGL